LSAGGYLDDDTGIPELTQQAAARGLRIVRSDDVGMRGKDDEEHLVWAAANRLALVTCNRRDYFELHWRWLQEGREHAGIVIVNANLRRSERIRRLLMLFEIAQPADLAGCLEFLSDWD
jgi:hypothetical protein